MWNYNVYRYALLTCVIRQIRYCTHYVYNDENKNTNWIISIDADRISSASLFSFRLDRERELFTSLYYRGVCIVYVFLLHLFFCFVFVLSFSVVLAYYSIHTSTNRTSATHLPSRCISYWNHRVALLPHKHTTTNGVKHVLGCI